MTGLAALTVNLDPAMVNLDFISVPGDYNVEFDKWGYPAVFQPVPGK